MLTQPDRGIEQRGSMEEVQQSRWKLIFRRILCKCLYPNENEAASILNRTGDGVNERDSTRKPLQNRRKDCAIELYGRSIADQSDIESSLSEKYNDRMALGYFENRFSLIHVSNKSTEKALIYNYFEDQVQQIGFGDHYMLCLISDVLLSPSPATLKNSIGCANYEDVKTTDQIFEEFWSHRYYFFERFDDGVKLDLSELDCMIPEAVSEYLAHKCNGMQTILDAYAGMGGNSIKLANSCRKLIAYEPNPKKYSCLQINTQVYEVDNITLIPTHFIGCNTKVDTVFLMPLKININEAEENGSNHNNSNKSIEDEILKAMQLAPNIIVLLPICADIKTIAVAFHKACIGCNQTATCSFKVDRIRIGKSFSYIAVYFGPGVQNQVRLNEELNFLYQSLKMKQPYKHNDQKLIKLLREKEGMPKLLTIVNNVLKQRKDGEKHIDALYRFTQENKLLPEKKINELKAENVEMILEYPKDVENVDSSLDPTGSRSERTQSIYSNTSASFSTEHQDRSSQEGSRNNDQRLPSSIVKVCVEDSGFKKRSLTFVSDESEDNERRSVHNN